MPRVLVADDNSNIHRAISVALKDKGVEVVAVGNGEAALRKMAEIKPDLVLADIFMPVRSGYEVCEFVKNDARFSAAPVVLLIGAFDPFDEREAQRVKADAILKKPFVPPEALVQTVMDLLARSGTKPAAAAAPAEAKEEEPRGSAPAAEQAAEYSDLPPEEFSQPRPSLKLSPGEQTVAFESLLEAPAQADAAEEMTVTSQRDPNLGEPAFWGPAEGRSQLSQDEEGAEEDSTAAASGGPEAEDWQIAQLLEPYPGDAETGPAREPVVAEADSIPELPPFPPPVGEVIAPGQALTSIQKETAGASVHELPVANLPAPPEPQAAMELPEARGGGTDNRAANEHLHPLPESDRSSWPGAKQGLEESSASQAPAAEAKSGEGDFATLAPFLASLTRAGGRYFEKEAVAEQGTPATSAAQAGQPAATLAAIAEGASRSGEAIPAAAAEPAQLDAAAMELVVQRVIERMQPQIIDLLTRELLRPVVEALVQRALEKT